MDTTTSSPKVLSLAEVSRPYKWRVSFLPRSLARETIGAQTQRQELAEGDMPRESVMSIDQLNYYSVSALLLFLLGIVVAGVTSSVLFSRMFQEVNERLPSEEKMSPWFGHPGVLPKVERLHRKFYPDSNLRRNLNRIIAGGVAAVVGLVISFDLM